MKYTFLFIAVLFITLIASVLSADDNTIQSGEIKIEQEEKKVDSYFETEEQAIVEFDKLLSFTESKDLKSIPDNLKLSDDILVHLNAYYLYCSTSRGVCPHILDAILEFDLINSRKNKVAACPNMLKFWKLWLDNDMEKRHQYQVKTGYIQQTTEFKNKVRPMYLKCQGTINDLLKLENVDDNNYFINRYSENSAIIKSIENVLKDLKQAKDSNINFMISTGLKK
jgi:hypothetical protein